MGIGLEGCSREEIVFTNIQGRDCIHIHPVKIFFSQNLRKQLYSNIFREGIVLKIIQERDCIIKYLGKGLYSLLSKEVIVFTNISGKYLFTTIQKIN